MKKIKYLTFRMRSCSNRVIELNLNMLLLKIFVMTIVLTINLKQYLNTNNFSSNLHKQQNYILQKYSIKNSNEKLFVFKYCFKFIVVGLDTSTPVSKVWTHRCHKGSTGRRGLSVCHGQCCN
jgi:hypothetical protein